MNAFDPPSAAIVRRIRHPVCSSRGMPASSKSFLDWWVSPNSNSAVMLAWLAPGLTISALDRWPSIRLSAPRRMDLPAPDSPVMVVSPFSKSIFR